MSLVVSSGMVLTKPVRIPLAHPRLFYRDLFQAGTLVASSEQEDFEAENAIDGLTYDFWRPASLPATFEVRLDEAATVDYALIAAHTLGSSRCVVHFEAYIGGQWVPLIETAPGTDKVLALIFDPAFSNRYRLRITGSAIPSIGVLMAGESLQLPRGVKLDHVPISLSRRTTTRPNKSEGGQWLGRSIRREGAATKISIENLESDWIYTHLDPFIEAVRTRPFGWAWAPLDRPTDVAYCWTNSDIAPPFAGLQNRMNVEFDVEGILD